MGGYSQLKLGNSDSVDRDNAKPSLTRGVVGGGVDNHSYGR